VGLRSGMNMKMNFNFIVIITKQQRFPCELCHRIADFLCHLRIPERGGGKA
jgi:hypothetical protein